MVAWGGVEGWREALEMERVVDTKHCLSIKVKVVNFLGENGRSLFIGNIFTVRIL